MEKNTCALVFQWEIISNHLIHFIVSFLTDLTKHTTLNFLWHFIGNIWSHHVHKVISESISWLNESYICTSIVFCTHQTHSPSVFFSFYQIFSSFNWISFSWQHLWNFNWFVVCTNFGTVDFQMRKKFKVNTIKWKHSGHTFFPNAMLFNDIGDVTDVQWLFIHLPRNGSLANYIDCIKWFINYMEISWLSQLHSFRFWNYIFDLFPKKKNNNHIEHLDFQDKQLTR